MPSVTIPGGTGPVIALPFVSADDANLVSLLLERYFSVAVQQNEVFASSSGNHAAVAGDQNLLVADLPGLFDLPAGYQYLADAYAAQTISNNGTLERVPPNSFFAYGTLDAAAITSTAGSVQFVAGTGMETIVAGGSISISTLASGTPGGQIVLDGSGRDGLTLSSGTWNITTGTGPASITLGSGNDTLVANGPDTIHAGSGTTIVTMEASGEHLFGGAGHLVVDVEAPSEAISGGSGDATVTANAPGQSISGGGAEVLFVDHTGGNQLVGNNSGLVIYGTTIGGSSYQDGNSYVIFVSEGGTDTIRAGVGQTAPVVFGFNNCDVIVDSAQSQPFFVGGSGNETMDASGSNAISTFFSGVGNIDMIGAAHAANYYAGNTGNSTMTGGTGNIYQFFNGHGGGTDLITSFGAYDQLYLTGFGSANGDGIAYEMPVNGVLHMQLTDGTLIIFQNLSSASQLSGHIHG